MATRTPAAGNCVVYAGDVVEMTVEGIGTIRNRVVEGRTPAGAAGAPAPPPPDTLGDAFGSAHQHTAEPAVAGLVRHGRMPAQR